MEGSAWLWLLLCLSAAPIGQPCFEVLQGTNIDGPSSDSSTTFSVSECWAQCAADVTCTSAVSYYIFFGYACTFFDIADSREHLVAQSLYKAYVPCDPCFEALPDATINSPNIGAVTAVDAADCWDQCQAHSNCTAAILRSNGQCILMDIDDSRDRLVFEAGTQSLLPCLYTTMAPPTTIYQSEAPVPCFEAHTSREIVGQDMSSFVSHSQEECWLACSSQAGCTAATLRLLYFNGTSNCSLSSSPDPLNDMSPGLFDIVLTNCTPTTTAAPLPCFEILAGKDIVGQTIEEASGFLLSEEECWAACAENEDCTAVTYERSIFLGVDCYLKNSSDPRQDATLSSPTNVLVPCLEPTAQPSTTAYARSTSTSTDAKTTTETNAATKAETSTESETSSEAETTTESKISHAQSSRSLQATTMTGETSFVPVSTSKQASTTTSQFTTTAASNTPTEAVETTSSDRSSTSTIAPTSVKPSTTEVTTSKAPTTIEQPTTSTQDLRTSAATSTTDVPTTTWTEKTAKARSTTAEALRSPTKAPSCFDTLTDTTLVGEGVAALVGLGEAQCWADCEREAACTAAVYRPSTGGCSLKNASDPLGAAEAHASDTLLLPCGLTAAPTTTSAPRSTSAPKTSSGPASTSAPKTSSGPTSTIAPKTSSGPTSTSAPKTTSEPTSTIAPETSSEATSGTPSIRTTSTSAPESSTRPTSTPAHKSSTETGMTSTPAPESSTGASETSTSTLAGPTSAPSPQTSTVEIETSTKERPTSTPETESTTEVAGTSTGEGVTSTVETKTTTKSVETSTQDRWTSTLEAEGTTRAVETSTGDDEPTSTLAEETSTAKRKTSTAESATTTVQQTSNGAGTSTLMPSSTAKVGVTTTVVRTAAAETTVAKTSSEVMSTATSSTSTEPPIKTTDPETSSTQLASTAEAATAAPTTPSTTSTLLPNSTMREASTERDSNNVINTTPTVSKEQPTISSKTKTTTSQATATELQTSSTGGGTTSQDSSTTPSTSAPDSTTIALTSLSSTVRPVTSTRPATTATEGKSSTGRPSTTKDITSTPPATSTQDLTSTTMPDSTWQSTSTARELASTTAAETTITSTEADKTSEFTTSTKQETTTAEKTTKQARETTTMTTVGPTSSTVPVSTSTETETRAATEAAMTSTDGTTSTTRDPAQMDQMRKALATFTNLEESHVPDSVMEEILAGDTSGLEALIARMPVEPSNGDFEDLIDSLGAIVPTKSLKELEKLQKASIPLDEKTIEALEEFTGQPIPADIVRALDGGDEDAAIEWLDDLEPQPDADALAKLQASPDVPKKIKAVISQWADPPLEPTEAEKAVARVSGALPVPIPDDVAKRVAAGDAAALTEWMAQGPVLPTDREWLAMDLPSLPRAIRKQLEAYQKSQDDLWELGKLVEKMPLQLPQNVTGPLLSGQDTGPLLAWMEENEITPQMDDWDDFEGQEGVSKKVQEDLSAYKVRNCQGPFGGEWSEWSACPVTCGRGNKTRSRERTQPNCAEVDTLFCNMAFCAVDCSWTGWGSWGSCSTSCGDGTTVRYRKHEVAASELGEPCDGPTEEQRECVGTACEEPTVPPETAENLAKAGIEKEVAEEPSAFATAATDTIPFYIANLPVEEKIKMGHTLAGTVPLCSYNGVQCAADDFMTFYDESLGNCFTFNNATPAKYSTERPGAQSGLVLLLQSDQSDYLCTSQLGGFKLMIHNQTERPFADTEGFNVSPGKTSSISISQLELSKQPPPYGDCTAAKSPEFLYTGSHTLEGCLRSCYQRKLLELCGCSDPRFILPPNATGCGVEKKLCLDFYRNCRDDKAENNPMACKECTNPCESYQFMLTTSTSEMVDNILLDNVCAVNTDTGGGAETCKTAASMRRNFALIKIYYERLNLMRHREIQNYQMPNLISDFAGVLGITMGASVITMLEFLYALADLLLHAASRWKSSILK